MMRDTPVVSVILPVCAWADSLAESVRAVLRQRFGDFELLLVVAPGEAGTLPVEDERVRVLEPKRSGWAAAFNLALQHTRSPFIAFVGKGGRWAPDFLGRHIEHLRRAPSLGVSLAPTSDAAEGRGRPVTGVLSPEALLVDAPRWHGASAVARRAALDEVAFRDWRSVYPELSCFDETLPACSSLDCLWRIGLGTRWGVAPLAGPAGATEVGITRHPPDRLVAGWRKALGRARATAPEAVARVEREATAHWLRYVARCAADVHDGATARALLGQSLRLAPTLALRQPAETLRVAKATAAALRFGAGPPSAASLVV